jgi:hypothetical protein
MKLLKFILLLALLRLSTSCSPSNTEGENEGRSHNMGKNCMSCHYPGGSGESAFSIAGTVYKEDKTTLYPYSVIKLFTGPNGTGTLKYTLTVDALGNFFTNGNINFTGGLYPAVTGATTTQYMNSSIDAGACNNCHTGVDTGRIWGK